MVMMKKKKDTADSSCCWHLFNLHKERSTHMSTNSLFADLLQVLKRKHCQWLFEEVTMKTQVLSLH